MQPTVTVAVASERSLLARLSKDHVSEQPHEARAALPPDAPKSSVAPQIHRGMKRWHRTWSLRSESQAMVRTTTRMYLESGWHSATTPCGTLYPLFLCARLAFLICSSAASELRSFGSYLGTRSVEGLGRERTPCSVEGLGREGTP